MRSYEDMLYFLRKIRNRTNRKQNTNNEFKIFPQDLINLFSRMRILSPSKSAQGMGNIHFLSLTFTQAGSFNRTSGDDPLAAASRGFIKRGQYRDILAAFLRFHQSRAV